MGMCAIRPFFDNDYFRIDRTLGDAFKEEIVRERDHFFIAKAHYGPAPLDQECFFSGVFFFSV